MSDLLKFIFCIALFAYLPIEGKISNQRLCGDPNCSDPVSLAKTLLRYNSDDSRILSFPSNVEVTIFSKSAGTREDLWGVEIGGKRGYAPKNLLREHKVLKRNLSYLIDTEDGETNEIKTEPTPDIPNNADVAADAGPPSVPSGGVSAESIPPDTAPLPNEIRRPYEVHDGTTFYITPSGNDEPPSLPPIQASTTDSSLKPSAVDTPPPVQVDEPNASMLLPSPATSSNEVEPPQDSVPEEQEGSAIYNYISSFLPGDSGSGSKESASEGSEEYEDDEDYDDDEESSEEDVGLNTKVDDKLVGSEEVLASNSVGSNEASDSNPKGSEEIQHSEEIPDSTPVSEEVPYINTIASKEFPDSNPISEEAADSNPIVSEEVPDSNLTDGEPQVIAQVVENVTSENSANNFVDGNSEAQVFEISENKVETNVIEPNEFIGENVNVNKVVNEDIVSIVGQEASNSAQDKAQAVHSSELRSETKSVEEENNVEVDGELGNESGSHSIEVQTSSHKVEVVPQDMNIEKTEETLLPLPPVDLPSNSNPESADFDQTHSVEMNASGNSTPELVHTGTNENSVNSGETIVDSTEKLPETIGGGMEINPEPPVRSIFDFISNRDSLSEEIVTTEVPNPTDDSTDELLNHENIEQTTVTPEQAAEIPEQATEIPEQATEIPEQTSQANSPNSTTEKTAPLADEESETIINSSVADDETSESLVNNVLNDESSEEVVEPESEAGFFSSITDLLYSIPSIFTSSPSPPNPIEDLSTDETEPRVDQTRETEAVQEPDKPTDTLSGWIAHNAGAPSDCTDETVSETDETYSMLPSLSKVVGDITSMQDIEKSGPAVSLIITAITVLLFTLGYYFIEKSRRDSSFIAKINSLERSLFISSKECQQVKDDLEATKGMLTVEHTSLASNETLTDELHAELEELRTAVITYEEQISNLQVELDTATDTGLEVNRMLTEVLEQNGASSTLLEGFNTLQNQLSHQQKELIAMSDQLKEKATEAEALHAKLVGAEEQCAHLENELDSLTQSFNEMMSEKLLDSSAHEAEIKALMAELNAARKQIAGEEEATLRRERFFEERMEGMEEELKRALAEYDELKEMWRSVTVNECGDGGLLNPNDFRELMEVTAVRADLALIIEERDRLLDQLHEERGAHALLEDHHFLVDAELNQLREDRAVAESNEAAAVHKLDVLKKYFDEKEAELQSELDEARAVMSDASGQQVSSEEAVRLTSEQIKLLEEQNKALRQEVIEQESLRKEQLRSAEAKYNEAWLSSKQLERKLEEAKQEAAMLRNRLTIAEGAQGEQLNGETRLAGDLNGDLPTSPLHMGHVDLPIFPPFVSPHLGGGIPFMPPPTYPQDRRPPPLGCMSSPPLLPPPPPQHFARHYDRQQHSPDRHSPDRPAFRGGRQAGFRPLPPTANKSKGSAAGSSNSSESLEQASNQQA